MAKQKSLWCCGECGHSQSKWSGQCPQCARWNTLHEEAVVTPAARFSTPFTSKPVSVEEIATEEVPRLKSQMAEFDRLLGGGIVRGSLTLIGGDPGIGKSTLLLQISHLLARQAVRVLYVCGEESVAQTSLRAKRIGAAHKELLLLSETQLSSIRHHIETVRPEVVIIDSIQIIYKEELSSAPGSVSQVRETATELMHLAKGRAISIFLIGHVTKTGELAGPRVLEHLVDTVLYFEGERQQNYRMLRVVKNRFGSTDELAVFEMQGQGLKEVVNPSKLFLEERMQESPGSVVIPTIEGSRPILVEVQALVTDTVYTTPSRRSTGIDPNRLALLLAVLEKRVGYQLHNRDVFVSIAGGLKIGEPAIDLGIILAVASSLTNRAISGDLVVLGEVGLGGEVRGIGRIAERLKEALHMGFRRALLPKRNQEGALPLETHGVDYVEEAIRTALL